MARGVPIGYVHNWTYRGRWNEKKISPGLWKGTFNATKRKKSGKGGFKKGDRIKWKIWGYQTAEKTRRGEYQTKFKFYKKKIKTQIK